MKAKRDEVIGQARQFFAGHEYSEFYSAVAYSGYKHATDKQAEVMADFALSREAELRTRIADDLEAMTSKPLPLLKSALDYYSKELRGE